MWHWFIGQNTTFKIETCQPTPKKVKSTWMVSRAQKVIETWETLIRTTKVLSWNLYRFLTLPKNVTLTYRAKHDLVETCLPTPKRVKSIWMASRDQKVIETWETLIRTTKVLSSNIYPFLTLPKNVTLTYRTKHDLLETCLPTPKKVKSTWMVSRDQEVIETWETLIRTTRVWNSNLYRFLTLPKNVTLTYRAKHDLVETLTKPEIWLNGFQSSESDRNLGNFDPNC